MKHQPSIATEFHKAKELGMTHVIILLIGKLFRATEAPKDSLVSGQPNMKYGYDRYCFSFFFRLKLHVQAYCVGLWMFVWSLGLWLLWSHFATCCVFRRRNAAVLNLRSMIFQRCLVGERVQGGRLLDIST